MKELSTITVTAHASMDFTPNQMTISLTFKNTYKEYAQATEQASLHQKYVVDILQRNNLDTSLAKTSDFSIEKDIVSIRDKNHNEKERKFLGYKLLQEIEITLDVNNDFINQLLNQITEKLPQAEFSISYSLKDEQQAELSVLAEAVKKAQIQATTIASAANCTLDGIKTINPKLNNREPFFNLMATGFCAFRKNDINESFLNIYPKDITIKQEVTIVWYIK